MSGKIVEVSANIGVSATVAVVAILRANLSVQHMLGAARFSREVGRLERENDGRPFGEFWELILQNSIACVLMSVASLEAYANELFSDRNDIFPGYTQDLLHNLWETYEQKRILEKFDFALLLLKKPVLNRGLLPYQDARTLIELRNALTHFKPEWENEADEHKRISERVFGKFAGSSFLNDKLLYPRRWASHSCTCWVVRSALAFATEFERQSGLKKQKFTVGDPSLLEP